MREYLVFQMHGPLAACGDIAVGEKRRTAAWPGRSAVTGLLAAVLGLDRSQDEAYVRLAQALGLALRVDVQGQPLADYHTVQAGKILVKRTYRTRRDELLDMLDADERPETKPLSVRDYLQDSLFTLAVWLRHAVDWSLADLEKALRRPAFSPYLGRRCCPPALPFAPRRGEHASILAALDDYRPDRLVLGRLRASNGPDSAQGTLYACDADAEGGPAEADVHWRRDVPLSRAGTFQFHVREEHVARLPHRSASQEDKPCSSPD